MKRIFATLCIYFAFLIAPDAQTFHPSISAGTPAQTGMSSERLGRVDSVLQRSIRDQWTNAAVALVIRNGKIAYYKSFGYDNIEQRSPMPKDDIFRIASQTKAITSVAIMMLYEEGKIMLDDPVSKYIPSFKHTAVLDRFNPKDTTWTTVPAKKEITIKNLLTHTSGIGYPQIGDSPISIIYKKYGLTCGLGLNHRSLGDDMKTLGTLPLLHQPGEKFTYGINTDVLGYIVELVSGMPLDVFFRKRIFDPLGMKDTWFYLPPDKQSRLVNLYIVEPDGRLTRSDGYLDIEGNGTRMKDYPKEKGTYFSGGAGLSSTIMDYAIFLQMLLNGGEYNGVRLLARNTVRMMTTNQIEGVGDFGLGFQITSRQSSASSPAQEGSYGWGGAFSTVYWVDPKEKMVGLLYKQLWNSPHGGELDRKYKATVYQAIND